ncbi:uncharacterized protein DEA37_0009586 [Paragonimus westermani]|uniref:Uncharacterized protein n=1 Tax=Paragonimus westermani TaxID=34504 RepID=A0A5J4NMH4_9TREM|nr:uncharacterized protein DEA37_0009586 [Paragonimus westermani]
MTSLDVELPYTNDPFDEVINIVCNHAIEHQLILAIHIDELSKLLRMCTFVIQLMFHGIFMDK